MPSDLIRERIPGSRKENAPKQLEPGSDSIRTGLLSTSAEEARSARSAFGGRTSIMPLDPAGIFADGILRDRYSATLIGRFDALGLLCRGRFTLLLPLRILRRHGFVAGDAVHRLGRGGFFRSCGPGGDGGTGRSRRWSRTGVLAGDIARAGLGGADTQNDDGAARENEMSRIHRASPLFPSFDQWRLWTALRGLRRTSAPSACSLPANKFAFLDLTKRRPSRRDLTN